MCDLMAVPYHSSSRQAWRKGSELAGEARDFLTVVARAITAVLRLPENKPLLKAGVAKVSALFPNPQPALWGKKNPISA